MKVEPDRTSCAAILAECHSGHDADVLERAVALVVEKNACLRIHGNVDVRPAILVVVERGDRK